MSVFWVLTDKCTIPIREESLQFPLEFFPTVLGDAGEGGTAGEAGGETSIQPFKP